MIQCKKLIAETLAQAITLAANDKAMQRKVAEVGEKIRAEEGVAGAVRLIEQYSADTVLVPSHLTLT